MLNDVIAREADLNQFPSLIKSNSKHISLGDLHGNTLKLIYVLVEEGFLDLDEARYNTLRDIYNTDVRFLNKEQLELFKNIIETATVNSTKALTLIGDELADRGNNDYFTLLVLKKLHSSKVNVDVLLSNHSAEFIRDYDRLKFTGQYYLGKGQGQSLTNMHYLISRGLVAEEEIRDIVDQCYKPMVRAISYTVSPEGQITVFTHAPNGLETIQALAKKFGLVYKDNTPKDLIKTIDQVNAKIDELFSRKQLSNLIDEEGSINPEYPISPKQKPLRRLIWNRVVGKELITETSSGIKVNFVHGHIGDGPLLRNGRIVSSHQNLDTSFAKSPQLIKTGYNFRYGIDIEHITRHSKDFTALELTDDFLNTISTSYVMNMAENRFNVLLANLKIKTDELIAKGTKGNEAYNKKYEQAARSAKNLYDTLYKAGNSFFTQKITKESFPSFCNAVVHSIADANNELPKHRSAWYNLNPILKGFLGIISLLLVIPAFIATSVQQGYLGTFFNPRATDSAEKLAVFDKGIQQVIKDLRQVHEEEPSDKQSPSGSMGS